MLGVADKVVAGVGVGPILRSLLNFSAAPLHFTLQSTIYTSSSSTHLARIVAALEHAEIEGRHRQFSAAAQWLPAAPGVVDRQA